ncbi:MAG: hypothetical protein V4700_04065 [Pseudomonadota bacterium]
MPKKKTNQLASRERNFNEAEEVFDTTLQSVQSTSLLPYVDNSSGLSYFHNTGFQVYDNPAHSDFQTVLLAWMPTLMHDVTVLPQQVTSLHQGYVTPYSPAASTQAVMATTSAALLPYKNNQTISKLTTSLFEKTAMPCEMSWELELNNVLPTMILKVPFCSNPPFSEQHYNFPCLSGEEGKLLSGPITTADSFVGQHYKCAMEWFKLLRSCVFPYDLSNQNIANLVTYQITYDSLLQTFNVLHVYLSINQNDVKQEIFVNIENYCEQFSTFARPRDLFQQDPIEIEKQVESLEELSRNFAWLLMVQGLLQTTKQGIDSFHRVSPDLILYVQNGPFSSPEDCRLTGLLSWLHALTLLSNISALAQYTAETSDQTGCFLKQEYTSKMLQFTLSKKRALPNSRGISTGFIREQLDKRAESRGNLYQLPCLEEEVLLTYFDYLDLVFLLATSSIVVYKKFALTF